MPNWVYNRFEITAPAERLKEIKDTLFRSDEQPISFEKIVPRPAEHDDDWYNWNITHWGTKWDACDAVVQDTVGDSMLSYQFATAWAPPVNVLEAFVNAHPDVDVDFFYEEEQGWGGSFKVRKGELVEKDEYDVPDTHAEVVRRQGTCFCSVDEPMFPDCLFEQAKERGVTDPQVLEAIKGLGPGWSDSLDELIEAAHHL